MNHLPYYPHLKLLNTEASLRMLKYFGLSACNIAEFCGVSPGIVGKWYQGKKLNPTSRIGVSELTYRVLALQKAGKLPLPQSNPRITVPLLRTLLASHEVSMSLLKTADISQETTDAAA